ncbi:MAG: phage holin [Parabacteroides sp.]|nr:phage holin [Parabacteroides sp.]
MNWKLRLKNKTTLITLLTTLVALIYQVLGAFNIVPGISEDSIITIVGIAVNALCLLGIVVDPTTDGITDSKQAMEYDKPKVDEVE